MLGVFAEFERGIIRERVNAGLARARANGTKLGRRRVKPSVEARILELRANGDSILKIGRTLGIGTALCSAFSNKDLGHHDESRRHADLSRRCNAGRAAARSSMTSRLCGNGVIRFGLRVI
jgi:DNA invertase Pin-like site-specific DNA recombinase